jgi:hypothetical protein
LRHLPQPKKDNLLRKQEKTPKTPFSANSRKKTTDSSNLTITKSTEIKKTAATLRISDIPANGYA